MTRAALILAGGAGTRLWPVSSDDLPKQFLPLFGGRTLLQLTVDRLSSLVDPSLIFISTNARYEALCRAALPELDPGNILTEPARRNTAPAIALCCFEIEARLGETTIAILPSDHYIGDEPAFRSVIQRAFEHAESSDDLVTIAINPTEPNTGFGYLHLGDEVAPGVVGLRRFVEKPTRSRAEEFLASGEYAWNGGMFVWRSSVFRAALQALAPEVARVTRENYGETASISIDFALMEKAQNVATVRGSFGWSDVGSWSSIARVIGQSPATVMLQDAENVFAISDRRVAVVGLSNIAVIDSPEGLLVLHLDDAEKLSELVKKMPKE